MVLIRSGESLFSDWIVIQLVTMWNCAWYFWETIKTVDWGNQFTVSDFTIFFHWKFKHLYTPSAGPFDDEWLGAVVICLIPFIVQNVLRSLPVKDTTKNTIILSIFLVWKFCAQFPHSFGWLAEITVFFAVRGSAIRYNYMEKVMSCKWMS